MQGEDGEIQMSWLTFNFYLTSSTIHKNIQKRIIHTPKHQIIWRHSVKI